MTEKEKRGESQPCRDGSWHQSGGKAGDWVPGQACSTQPGHCSSNESTSPPPSSWSQTPCNHHPIFHQLGDTTIIRTQLNISSSELWTARLFNNTKSISYLNVPPGVNVYQKELVIQEMCKDCSLSQNPFLTPLCHSDGDSQHFFCRSILHLNVTTTPIIASITDAWVCSHTPIPSLKKHHAYAAHWSDTCGKSLTH